MEILVKQTNVYAQQNSPSPRVVQHNHVRNVSFLGIIIAMGVHELPTLADYWSSDSLLGVPGIAAGMPIDQSKVQL